MKSWLVSLFDWAGDRGRKAPLCRGGGGIVGRPIRRGCIELSRLPDREVVAKPLLWQTGSVKRSLPPADSSGSWYIPKNLGAENQTRDTAACGGGPPPGGGWRTP